MTNERQIIPCSTRRAPSARKRYVVRWQDEDFGWRHVQIAAFSEQEARDIVGDLVERTDLQVRSC